MSATKKIVNMGQRNITLKGDVTLTPKMSIDLPIDDADYLLSLFPDEVIDVTVVIDVVPEQVEEAPIFSVTTPVVEEAPKDDEKQASEVETQDSSPVVDTVVDAPVVTDAEQPLAVDPVSVELEAPIVEEKTTLADRKKLAYDEARANGKTKEEAKAIAASVE